MKQDPPNIFRLYEENIGPITPMIADILKDIEVTYPNKWIDEAMQIAIKKNNRNLQYIEGILKRWQKEGKDDGTYRKTDKEDEKRLIEEEFKRRFG